MDFKGNETAALAVLHGVVARIDRKSGSAAFSSDEHWRMVGALEALTRAHALRVAQAATARAAAPRPLTDPLLEAGRECRWSWFSDAELLALRYGLNLGSDYDGSTALYREVCAAIDARPSCVLRAVHPGDEGYHGDGTSSAVEAAPRRTPDNRTILCGAPLSRPAGGRCTLPVGHAGSHARVGGAS